MTAPTEDDHAMSIDPQTPERRPTGDPGLDRLIQCLPPQIPPEKDLWREIEPRLTRRGAGPSWRTTFGTLAGLALAAGLVGALLGLGWLFRSTPDAASPDAMVSQPATPEDGYRVPAAGAFDRSLMAALERQRLQLGPDTANAVEADISRLGSAVSELLMALASNPDDPALHRHLAARQHQQAQLLTRLSRL